MPCVQIQVTRPATRELEARLVHVAIQEIEEEERGFEGLPTDVRKRARSARP